MRRIGGSALSAALASLGVSAFTSCTEEGKKRLVFYFTATGNCLYTALQFSATPLSIPQVMKETDLVFEADEIGLVFPDYQARAPQIVQRFLEKATLKAPYLFSIITYGRWACNIVEWWNDFALSHGVRFNYITTILMVDNYLPVFDMAEEMKMDKREDEHRPSRRRRRRQERLHPRPQRRGAQALRGRPCPPDTHPPRPERNPLPPASGPLRRLLFLHPRLSPPMHQPHFARHHLRGRLRILPRLHPKLSAERHRADTRRTQPRGALPEPEHLNKRDCAGE